ncbi:MAG: protein translocase subunit SecDF [Lachnospiraceae bacterium]|nr:protein translocase subunit SecDF [Lachnospiraceae bacterium]
MKKSKALLIIIVVLALTLGIGYMDIWGYDGNGAGNASDIKLGLDLAGGVSITYQVVGDENPSETDMADTIYKLQQRVENYSTEAQVYQEGSNRITIEIPGVTDAETILAQLGRPGALYFISATDSEGNPNYSQQMVMNEDGTYGYEYGLNKTIDELMAEGSVVITGTDVADARAVVQQDNMKNNEFAVALSLTPEGAIKFAEGTQRAVDRGYETIGIYYDGSFVSVPRVNQAITDGEASITGGDFTYESASALASTIRIGGLSLELEELHSKVVGAQLGIDAIQTSLKAGAIGLAIVALFMIVIYFIPGLASAIALCFYVALIVLLLIGFNDVLTLTLPGIAGIILSIGMAVDANVVVFARIREELGKEASVEDAINTGYAKALSAIIDGNVTTLIAAVVLLFLGPSNVKGFAQTLALGIVVSMFTALFITKWLMKAFFALGLKSVALYGKGKEKKSIDFLSKKAIFIALSLIVIVAGFVFMGINKGAGKGALNYSLDFVGGTATTVDFNESYTLQQLNDTVVPEIEAVTGSTVQVQTVQNSNEVIFKTSTLESSVRQALEQMFMTKFGVASTSIQTETISSTISDEMKRDTIIAVIVAILCMLIYIRIRFKDFRFGFSSVLALVHDVLVVLAFYAAARVSVSNTFVACMLTIVGYSINATIVIFDRVRENMANAGKSDIVAIVNKSVTQTLSRSIFTSLTTFVMVALLYVMGVSSIKDFALPLMVGIGCGCYSSVCLAGAFWVILTQKFPAKAKKK